MQVSVSIGSVCEGNHQFQPHRPKVLPLRRYLSNKTTPNVHPPMPTQKQIPRTKSSIFPSTLPAINRARQPFHIGAIIMDENGYVVGPQWIIQHVLLHIEDGDESQAQAGKCAYTKDGKRQDRLPLSCSKPLLHPDFLFGLPAQKSGLHLFCL
jgi:hypothetical protein